MLFPVGQEQGASKQRDGQLAKATLRWLFLKFADLIGPTYPVSLGMQLYRLLLSILPVASSCCEVPILLPFSIWNLYDMIEP